MSVDPNWHHMIAVEGVGYSHHTIASMGHDWWSITVEVVDPSKAASAASIYNQSYKKYKGLDKKSDSNTQIVRVTIRYKGDIVSQRDYVRTVGKAIIYIAPIVQKTFNIMVQFKDSIRDKLYFKVKSK